MNYEFEHSQIWGSLYKRVNSFHPYCTVAREEDNSCNGGFMTGNVFPVFHFDGSDISVLKKSVLNFDQTTE